MEISKENLSVNTGMGSIFVRFLGLLVRLGVAKFLVQGNNEPDKLTNTPPHLQFMQQESCWYNSDFLYILF